jgi:hypothetical protein
MEWNGGKSEEGRGWMQLGGRESGSASRLSLPPFHLLLPYLLLTSQQFFPPRKIQMVEKLFEELLWLRRYSFLWVFLSLSH